MTGIHCRNVIISRGGRPVPVVCAVCGGHGCRYLVHWDQRLPLATNSVITLEQAMEAALTRYARAVQRVADLERMVRRLTLKLERLDGESAATEDARHLVDFDAVFPIPADITEMKS